VAWSILNLAVALLVVYGTLALFPRTLVIDALRGEPDVVAYYEGTQGYTTLTLRKNSKFDVFDSSWPGVSSFCGGTYARSGDELHMRFERPCDLLPERGYLRNGVILFNRKAGRDIAFTVVPKG
jgi:hypothetical protein